MFIDSHAHLDGERFAEDRREVLARARDAGVHSMLLIGSGTGPGSLDCAIQIADGQEGVYASVGIHPHEAQLAKHSDFDELAALARHPKTIAWGEIGLDFYDHSPRDVQKFVFLKQMELARSARLPIIIHCRPTDNTENAWDDVLAMIGQQHFKSSGLGGIIHCFTGTLDHMHRALDLGFMISFAGNITFPKAQNIRDAAKVVPLDRMLIETDCPFLAPVPYRGKRNEPAYVVEVARQIAELRGLSREDVGQRTSENFRRFFSLHEKPIAG